MKISSWFFLLGLVEGRALISYNGECGASNGLTCMSSIFGNCCSKDGTCGASSRHCGDGCQSDFGICTSMKYSNATSQDGTCGGSSMGFHCKGSVFGECCSQYGYCGNSSAYCDDGCDSKYGSCSPTKRSPALQERATPVGNATTEGIDLSISLGLSIGLGGGGATTTATATASASASASPTSSCVPCEGQPGSDPDSYCGYDINTDYYSFVPKTCRTVEYTFVVGNTTISPDGVPRIGLVINGSMPGPTIEANWGDTVKVHVINQMENNGTSKSQKCTQLISVAKSDQVSTSTESVKMERTSTMESRLLPSARLLLARASRTSGLQSLTELAGTTLISLSRLGREYLAPLSSMDLPVATTTWMPAQSCCRTGAT